MLNCKLEKEQAFYFGRMNGNDIEALKVRKEHLPSTLVLPLTRPKVSYSLNTGASDEQVRCALLQELPKGPNKDHRLRSL